MGFLNISENRGLIVGRVLQLYTMKHTLKISHILAFNIDLCTRGGERHVCVFVPKECV